MKKRSRVRKKEEKSKQMSDLRFLEINIIHTYVEHLNKHRLWKKRKFETMKVKRGFLIIWPYAQKQLIKKKKKFCADDSRIVWKNGSWKKVAWELHVLNLTFPGCRILVRDILDCPHP